jgi:ketosteroid isomerase-like protein
VKRLLAVALLALAQGCCHCGERPEHEARRPGDVVRALRDAIAEKRWDAAAACFSLEVLGQHGDDVRSGRFFRSHWTSPAQFPVEPGDALEGVVLRDDVAIATVLHECARDEQLGCSSAFWGPLHITLRRDAVGKWKISDWDPRT